MSAQPLTDRGRRTRDGLIAAARAVLEERGFAATRMGDISAAARVSHGTVYTWFNTKEDVLRAVIDSVSAELYDGLRSPTHEGPAESRIAWANRRYLEAYRDNARLLEVVEEAATSDASFRSVLADLRRAHVDRVMAVIARLQADGVADPDLDAGIAAAALCAMVEGFARNWTDVDDDQAVETLTRLWVHALGLTSAAHSTRGGDYAPHR
jgi:AcrR family transcriptional regulator